MATVSVISKLQLKKMRHHHHKMAKHKPNFPVADILSQLRAGKFKNSFHPEAAIFFGAILEYIATEVLEIAGNHAQTKFAHIVQEEDVIAAITRDKALGEVLGPALHEF